MHGRADLCPRWAELFRRHLAAIDLPGRLRALFRDTALDGDFGAARITLLLIGLLVIGRLRVTHLAFVGTDPMLLRFAGLHVAPADRTVVRWLKAFTPPALERLCALIRDLVYEQIERCRLARLTIDLDGCCARVPMWMGPSAASTRTIRRTPPTTR